MHDANYKNVNLINTTCARLILSVMLSSYMEIPSTWYSTVKSFIIRIFVNIFYVYLVFSNYIKKLTLLPVEVRLGVLKKFIVPFIKTICCPVKHCACVNVIIVVNTKTLYNIMDEFVTIQKYIHWVNYYEQLWLA